MSNIPNFEVDSFVSTAFVPGENPDNLWQDGSVLDKLCPKWKALGTASCEGCVFFDPNAEMAEDNLCAHQNLRSVLAEQGLQPEEVLMVGFTGDGIGFYDELNEAGKITEHRYGWGMITGYNAMFARTSEIKGLGGRAADCSVVKGSAPLPDGDKLMLLLHLTRDNIEGDSALSYGPDQNQSYIQEVLAAGAGKYGIAISDFELEQVAKIDQLDYTFKAGKVKTKTGEEVQVDAEGMMDAKFKGWFDQGLLHNISNPDWRRGDPIDPNDAWVAEYQKMTERVIRNSGVPLEQIDTTRAINPGDVTSGHASNAAANDPKREAYRKRPDARDLYLVTAREAHGGIAAPDTAHAVNVSTVEPVTVLPSEETIQGWLDKLAAEDSTAQEMSGRPDMSVEESYRLLRTAGERANAVAYLQDVRSRRESTVSAE